MLKIIVTICILAQLTACSGSGASKKQPKAPEGQPIALDPNPPMSASDIDAIINKHVQSNSAEHDQKKGKSR